MVLGYYCADTLFTPQCASGVCGAIASLEVFGAQQKTSAILDAGRSKANKVLREGDPTVKRQMNAGFTLLEALIVIAISLVLAGIAIPNFMNAINSYRFSAAVSAVTGALSTTRYQAIQHGYPYQLVFTSSTMSYKVYNDPGASSCPTTNSSYTLVGTAIPLPSAGPITMSGTSYTFTFCPNGTVSSTGNPQLSNNLKSRTITVSGVGNVSVTSP